jgi:acyl-CoA synthetase (AMP-forming)/AMP-acid ligase II
VNRHNMAVAFDRHCRDDPSATGLVVGDQRWTRAELADLADRVVGVLLEAGAKPGNTVISQYNTTAPDVAVALAAARLGCTFIPIPLRLGPHEFSYVVELAAPVLLVLRDLELAHQLPLPAHTTVRSSADIVSGPPVSAPFAAEPPDHVAVIGFTSGSTGRPKGVMHRWPQMAWTTQFLADLIALQPGESICVSGAGAGAPGFTFYTYFGLTFGAAIVQAERWNPHRVLELMARERCVWSTMVPTMLHMLLEVKQNEPDSPMPVHMRAISMGGAFMSDELIQRARAELGLEVLRVYAMAECMMACQMRRTDPEDDRDGADGWPGPGAEVAVFDGDGVTHLSGGEVGELGLKGPSLFEGYLGDPVTKPSRLTPDGFFLSGDMGRITPDGYVKVVGRKKDLIIRGGFNIDPVEVEELLRPLEGVRDVAVVGYPDERFGERACAVLLVQPGVEYQLSRVVDHLLGVGLSKEKLPERLLCVDDLPRSPDGKVLKAKLRDRVLETL